MKITMNIYVGYGRMIFLMGLTGVAMIQVLGDKSLEHCAEDRSAF